jgi:enoyl-CoA hydratase/carnithine racemase
MTDHFRAEHSGHVSTLTFGAPDSLNATFGTEKALRAGLVNEVLPLDQVRERAKETAEMLAALPPTSVRTSKRLLKEGNRAGLAIAMAGEGKALEAGFASKEPQEAIAAFFELSVPRGSLPRSTRQRTIEGVNVH